MAVEVLTADEAVEFAVTYPEVEYSGDCGVADELRYVEAEPEFDMYDELKLFCELFCCCVVPG